MKRFLVLLLLLLVSPTALADDQCRHINAHAFIQGQQFPCEYNDTEYFGCLNSSIRGTINGSWDSYYQDYWWVSLDDLGVPTAYPSFYGREFEVFTTKKGMVWGDAQFTIDLRYAESGGGFAVETIVTGGTGMYEDAHGWITAIVTDSEQTTFSVHGRVCGPNIDDD